MSQPPPPPPPFRPPLTPSNTSLGGGGGAAGSIAGWSSICVLTRAACRIMHATLCHLRQCFCYPASPDLIVFYIKHTK